MQKKLLRHYLTINLPGIASFIILYILVKFHVNIFLPVQKGWVQVVMMIASGLFAVVLPLWYRILFVNRMKGKANTDKHRFIQFERDFLTLASVSVYILVAGFILAMPRIPLAVMVLFVIYALYFYFPSEKRIRSEKKIFKVE
jgi:hypothetical protein